MNSKDEQSLGDNINKNESGDRVVPDPGNFIKEKINKQKEEILDLNRRLELYSAELEQFRFIINLISDFVFTISFNDEAKLKLEWISRNFNETMGYSFDALLDAEQSRNVLHHDDYMLFQDALKKASGGESVSIEIRLFHTPREIIWYNFALYPLFEDSKSRVSRLYGVCSRISEYRRRERDMERLNNELQLLVKEKEVLFEEAVKNLQDELKIRKLTEVKFRESEERFKQIVDRFPYALALHQHGKIIYVNLKTIQLLGANSIYEVVGKDISNFVHPDYKQKHLERVQEEVNKPDLYPPAAEKYYRLDGKLIEVEVISIPFMLNGKPAYQDIFIDITKTKHTNEQLRKLSSAVEQSSSGILITDINGFIEYVNPKISQITGFEKADLIGRKPIIFNSGKQPEELYKKLWDTILAGRNWTGELVNKKKSGEYYTEFISISPIKNDEGELTNFLAVIEDITSRKKIEAELIKSKNEAEEAIRAKSLLIANISHELRTPLNAVLGFAQLLSDNVKNRESSEIIEKISFSGKRLLNTLNLVLTATELESKDYSTTQSEIDLKRLCTKIKLIFEPQAAQKLLKFELSLPVDNIKINSDEYLLSGIILNLVENAIKYTKTGLVRLELNPNIRYEGKDFILINVKDTGIGIKKEDREIIFREFRQVSEGFQRDFEGLGLGLSIANKMAKLLGIKILVESEWSKGSNFSILIPLNEGSMLSKANSEMSLVRDTHLPSTESLKKRELKILLVEDNLLNIEVVKMYLKNYWDVSSVRNGEDAIKTANKSHFDLLLIDINLGHGIDGIEVLKQIKQINDYEQIPSIAITGYASEKYRKIFLEHGFTNYLPKPFYRKDLVDLIKEVVKMN